jgi:dihydropteroate synthase
MTIYPLTVCSNNLLDECYKIGCTEKAFSFFQKKFDVLPIKIHSVKSPMANIIKQEMISSKGDAVVHARTISCKIDSTDVLLLGTQSVYQDFFRKMEYQNYPSLVVLSKDLKKLIENFHNKTPIQTTRNNRKIDYSKPVLMGILNVTENSFYDGGKYLNLDNALAHCEKMISDGANIIDVGGESSKPGSDPISVEQEMERVIPLIKRISQNFDVVISVDTVKAEVAEEAMKAGADVINDISALQHDPKVKEIAKNYQAILILMHSKGTPKNMQENPFYEDVIRELIEFFDERVNMALKEGLSIEQLIIDPGIGFGKRLVDNQVILKNLAAFKKYGIPIMVGASRKSMVGMMLGNSDAVNAGIKPPEERLYGTLGAHAAAFMRGADILRVHDVKEHFELLKALNFIK